MLNTLSCSELRCLGNYEKDANIDVTNCVNYYWHFKPFAFFQRATFNFYQFNILVIVIVTFWLSITQFIVLGPEWAVSATSKMLNENYLLQRIQTNKKAITKQILPKRFYLNYFWINFLPLSWNLMKFVVHIEMFTPIRINVLWQTLFCRSVCRKSQEVLRILKNSPLWLKGFLKLIYICMSSLTLPEITGIPVCYSLSTHVYWL